jgi:hypothetical protein
MGRYSPPGGSLSLVRALHSLRAYPRLLVLRGFSRNVKQDSAANEVSGGESEANVVFFANGWKAPCENSPASAGLEFTAARKPATGEYRPIGCNIYAVISET